jgi:serine/threonine-protein kinase
MSGTASALVAPGAVVAGKYRLDSIVGEGGMGAVWSATHTGLGQSVAIKFISKEFVTSPEALRRFDAEAKAAAQLRSRHVVQVFDNGTLEDGTPYIAMELLRGESLYARVHRAGPIPLIEAVEILAQACRALGRAHAAGIIHRDVKPDNIFLSQSADDDAMVVKVLDFGIAKFAVGPNDHGSTRTGAVLGTPLYMSPEQARGLKSIDQRTDLYSLGLVAYTIFTGNLAFSSESFGDLLLQICTAPLPSLCANAPWLPASMEGWFQRACAREPANRFGTAQEFADSLRMASALAFPGPAMPGSMQASGGLAAANTPNPAGQTGNPQARSVGTDAAMSRSGGAVTGGPASATAAASSKGAVVAMAVVFGLLAIAAVVAFAAFSRRGAAVGAPPPVVAVAPPPPVTTLAPPVGLTPVDKPVSPAAANVPTAPPTSTVAASAAAVAVPGASARAPEGARPPTSAIAPPSHSPLSPHAPPPAGPAPPHPAPPPAAGAGTKPIDLGY